MPPGMFRHYEGMMLQIPEGHVSAVCFGGMPVSIHSTYIIAVRAAEDLAEEINVTAA